MQAMYNCLAAVVLEIHQLKWQSLPWEPLYNENVVNRYDCISRDDLNFLAQFLLRLATRLENLEKIKTNKKPKN